jgi:hypothetical protein
MRRLALIPALLAPLALAACDRDGDGVRGKSDCNDRDARISPLEDEVCDRLDNDCDGVVDEAVFWAYTDRDGDGAFGTREQLCHLPDTFATLPTDCDDARGDVYPGASETCNGRDDDCDGFVDVDGAAAIYWFDADGDGYAPARPVEAACEPRDSFVLALGDCDDSDAARFPGARETCNEVDDDCNWLIDDVSGGCR